MPFRWNQTRKAALIKNINGAWQGEKWLIIHNIWGLSILPSLRSGAAVAAVPSALTAFQTISSAVAFQAGATKKKKTSHAIGYYYYYFLKLLNIYFKIKQTNDISSTWERQCGNKNT